MAGEPRGGGSSSGSSTKKKDNKPWWMIEFPRSASDILPNLFAPTAYAAKAQGDAETPWWLTSFPHSRSEFLQNIYAPSAYLSKAPWQGARIGGSVLGVLGTSPYAAALFPKSTIENAWSTLRGVYEGPVAIGTEIKHEGFGAAAKMLWESMKQDYKDRYGEDWEQHAKENPLFNLFDTLTLVGSGARAAAFAGAADRLGAAGAKITLKNLWKESSRPGLISTGHLGEEGKWVPGEAFTRAIEYQPETGPAQVIQQPLSRSPFMRGVGDVAEGISERFPDAPIFGAGSRVARAKGSQMRRVMERTLGAVVGEEALNGLGDAGRTRLFWESQLLSAPGDGKILRKLRTALDKEWDSDFSDVADPKFRDVLLAAKQAGFGKGVLLKRLDAAIDYKPGRRYAHAWDALEQATVVSERTILDANGFTALKNDMVRLNDRLGMLEPGSDAWRAAMMERNNLALQLAKKRGDLETMLANRKNLLRDWLDTKGSNDFTEAWRAVLAKALGDQDKADQMIAFANALANKIRPDDPESWWRDKIGMPDPRDFTEGGVAFRERKGLDALFQNFGEDVRYGVPDIRLIEGRVEDLLPTSPFYSPTMKWVAENMPEKMTVAQLRSAVIKHGGDSEYYNSGLDMYFQKMENTDIILKSEFLNVLANRLNAYNLRQIVRVNTRESAEQLGLSTLYDYEHQGNYISRGKDAGKPHPGEYYEVQFELPGPGRDEIYRGKGEGHWNRQNVVAHFRFHVFEEDGVRKLLVEEIQSDWANEWREAQKARAKIADMSPELRAEYDAVKTRQEELQVEYRKLRSRSEELDRRIAHLDLADKGMAEPTGIAQDVNASVRSAMLDEFQQGMERMRSIREEMAQNWRILEDADMAENMHTVPQSPLGTGMSAKNSYINSPIRWIGRFAVENDIDQVILVSREAQLARNARVVDMRDWHGLKVKGAEAVTEYVRGKMGTTRDYIGYDTDIPKRMAEEWGVVGRKTDSAYDGFYRHPMDFEGDASGRMPGTVFDVNDAFREAASKAKSMYQETPDWPKLPKGAVEMFRGGKSRVHFFKEGDVSTWIHELGHIAMHDLSEADQKIIQTHFAGGKHFDDWTDMQHEDFARAFEQYVREGVAPTRPLRPIFAKISAWIKQVWEREKRVNEDIPPEVDEVFARLFKIEDGPRIFMPHRPGAPDLAGGRTSRGQPRANREIGTEVKSRIPLFKANDLYLMRSGLLNDDPRMLMEHTNRVVALARANQLREAVLEMAEPLPPDKMPDFKTQYVVKKAGRGVDKATFDALESADDAEQVANTIENFIDDSITDKEVVYDQWKGESQLYVVDKKSVDLLFKYVTGKAPGAATKPTSNTLKVLDATLDSFRALLLYANPGFYVTNMVGNTGMMMLKDPAAAKYLPSAMREAVKAATKPEEANPLWQRVTTEMGRGPTSGSFSLGSIKDVLSGMPGEEGNLPGRAAEWWSHGLGEWGRRSGRVIDDAFRYAAWRQSAAKLGYDTDKKVRDLLNDESVQHPFRGKTTKLETKAEKDLAAIRAEAEQLMLDFDSMSPFERAYLQRLIFLYPFLKASAKYPFMFAGERPVTSGLLFGAGGLGSEIGTQVYGERPDLPEWLSGYARGPGGYINVGSFSPFNMPTEILASLINIRGPSEAGVQRPFDYPNPVWQLLVNLAQQQNEYGREVPVEDILLNELPLPAWMRYPIRKPSTQYAERDFWNTILRAIRIAPTQLSAGMGKPPSGGGGRSSGGSSSGGGEPRGGG